MSAAAVPDALRAASAPLASILLPLASAIGYVAAVLLVKRASAHGVGLWRTAFVSNAVMGLCFAPFWLLGGPDFALAALWQPALAAALFFAGQVFTFMALAGDVSLATPVLGLKIIFVAFASSLLVAEPVRPAWWIAAALSTVAIALLQASPRAGQIGGRNAAAPSGALQEGRHSCRPQCSPHPGPDGYEDGAAPCKPAHPAASPARTVACAALAALCYAFTDVLVQRFTPAWGPGRFLPLMFGLLAVFSLGLIPAFSAPLRCLSPAAWAWLLPGAVLLALQAASLGWTLGVHGRATAANILYSTRGLWSVLAVGLFGAWLGTAGERRLPRAVFRLRLVGASLMLAAVGLVLG